MADFSRDNTLGIVTDSATGMMWQDDANVSDTWEGAAGRCKALNLGGHNDWRLPSKKELHSIVFSGRYNPAINPAFKNSVSNGYWTSVPNATSPEYAWLIDFDDGTENWGYKTREHYVRCVRGGK